MENAMNDFKFRYMGKIYALTALSLFCFNITFCQIVVVKGKVIDKSNKMGLPNASVMVGKTGTITDIAGFFNLSVELNNLMSEGLIFTSSGYLSQHLIYQASHIYEVELNDNINNLQNVIVHADGISIVKKAFANIVSNYSNVNSVLTGISRVQYLRNNSDYFKSDAILKANIPPYTENKKADIILLQNKIDSIYDKSLPFIKLIGAYNTIANFDIAHNKPDFIQPSKMNHFSYTYFGKRLYENHNVFVINMVSKDTEKKGKQFEGVIYIDTASYAFVAANITQYHLVKAGAINTAKLHYSIVYQSISNKWYLKEIHTEGHSVYKNENPVSITDFIFTKLDTTNINPFIYKDIVQKEDVTQRINKKGDMNKWIMYDTLFSKAEKENHMGRISLQTIDSFKMKRDTSFKKCNLLNYFFNDNIRVSIGVAKFPLTISSSTNNIPNIANYGFDIQYYGKIVKKLFIQLQGAGNIKNSSGVSISQFGSYISKEFEYNKKFHPMIIAPFVGYTIITIKSKDKSQSFDYNSMALGFRASYELTHDGSVFMSTAYNNASNKSLGILNVTPTHFTISMGILIKK